MIYTKEIPKAEGLYPVRFRFGGGWAHGVAAAPRSTRIGFVHKNGAVQVLNERDVEWGPAIEFAPDWGRQVKVGPDENSGVFHTGPEAREGTGRESDDGAERPIIGMVGERILTRQDQRDVDGYLIRHDPNTRKLAAIVEGFLRAKSGFALDSAESALYRLCTSLADEAHKIATGAEE